MAQDWQKLLLAAGGAAAVCVVAYCLLKDDSDNAKLLDVPSTKKKGVAVDDITKEQVLNILQEIIRSQEEMKGHMKKLMQEVRLETYSFEQTYKKVKEVQPEDPLEKYGLGMNDFDTLLDKHSGDQAVKEAIVKIMGTPAPSLTETEKVKSITVKQIIDVHSFMLEELEKLNNDFQHLPNKASYDIKTVTIAAQALVGARIEQKFEITSEDIEGAVLHSHTSLHGNQEFTAINAKIQQTMAKLMGSNVGR